MSPKLLHSGAVVLSSPPSPQVAAPSVARDVAAGYNSDPRGYTVTSGQSPESELSSVPTPREYTVAGEDPANRKEQGALKESQQSLDRRDITESPKGFVTPKRIARSVSHSPSRPGILTNENMFPDWFADP